MRRLAHVCAVGLCVSANLHAQEPAALSPAPATIAESAARLAYEWWPTDAAAFVIDEEGRPRFRTTTTVTLPPPPWQLTPDTRPIPSRGSISHQEMLGVMTPQLATPLVSVSVDPGSIYQGIKSAWRGRQARRVHERVMKEIEELERLRKESVDDSR